jgi:hypothetical protein
MMNLPGHHVRLGHNPRQRNQRPNRQQGRGQHQPVLSINQPEQSQRQPVVRDIRSGHNGHDKDRKLKHRDTEKKLKPKQGENSLFILVLPIKILFLLSFPVFSVPLCLTVFSWFRDY